MFNKKMKMSKNFTKKVSALIAGLMLVSLMIPILTFAMYGFFSYTPDGTLAGAVYTKDPNSVIVDKQVGLSHVKLTRSGEVYKSGGYNDQNEPYYVVPYRYNNTVKPDNLTITDSTYSNTAFGDLFDRYTYYFVYNNERVSSYRMLGSLNLALSHGNSYLQPASTILTFTPTQSISNAIEVDFPQSGNSSTYINYSNLSANDLVFIDNSNLTQVNVSNIYQPVDNNTTYTLNTSKLIVKASNALLENHSYSLKLSNTSTGNEIKLPSSGTYNVGVSLGTLDFFTPEFLNPQGLTDYHIISSNSLFFDALSITDELPPTAITYSPANNATGVSIGSNLSLTFNESVTTVTNKNIIIKKVSDNSVTESIYANDSKVTISGTTVTINPSVDLTNSTAYYVVIDSGAFKDTANNLYAGISSSSTWSFTTAAAVSSGDTSEGSRNGGGTVSGGGSGVASGAETTVVTTVVTPEAKPVETSKTANGVQITLKPVIAKSDLGITTATVALNKESFNNALKQLDSNTKDKQVIKFDAGHSNADISNVSVAASALAAAASYKDAVLSIVSDDVTYDLPLKLLDLASLNKALGSDASNAKITITIEKISGAAGDKINAGAKAAGFEAIGNAIDFKITIDANGVKKEINDFGSTYVSRTIMIPQAITANQASAALYDPASGQFSFVPAIFSTVDGKTTITIKRNGNSQYLIVSSEKSFADTKNMYATDDINLLASKLIVNGITASEFKPNDKITRAQFTALLVRALGLTVETTASTFSDIKVSDWYANAISAAVKTGLIKGFEDGTFRPNDLITREQMASLISKALTITGKTVDVEGKVDQIISKFIDKANVSAWASTDTAKVTEAGIMQGNAGSFSPNAFADRAQAVVTLKRLLVFLQFIN